jgi:hypothetical protein
MMQSRYGWISSLAVGALLMYLFDPNHGRRRRALLRDRTFSLARRTGETLDGWMCDLQNRAEGVRARFQPSSDEQVDDSVLEARMRSALGRVTSHPGAIEVMSFNGIVTLSGPVLASEHAAVCRAAERVRGVVDLIDNTTQHESAGSIPALQGEARV